MSDFEPIDFTSIDDIPGINAKALFSSELSKTEFRETGDISPVSIGDKHRYMPWGADDQLPYDILELIERDETLSTCQMFNAEICYGSGLLYNTEACSEKVKEEIDSFFVGNNIPTNYLGVCQDFKYFAFCELIEVIRSSVEREESSLLVYTTLYPTEARLSPIFLAIIRFRSFSLVCPSLVYPASLPP